MVSEHGWDYNIESGPPQSWDRGKDAQSYYHVTDWFDLVTKSNTAIGDAELRGSIESPCMTCPKRTNSNTADPQATELLYSASASSNEAPEAVANAFSIMGHDDRVSETKKISGTGDGWMTEDTAPGIVEEKRVWRGIKTFHVPVLCEIQISEEPNVGSGSGAQAKADLGQSRRGVYRGRYRGKGNYRGREKTGTNRGAGGASTERWFVTRGW